MDYRNLIYIHVLYYLGVSCDYGRMGFTTYSTPTHLFGDTIAGDLVCHRALCIHAAS